MSDELDRFVLRYEVQMNDAVSRLEKLHEKTKKIEEASDDAAKGMKQFAEGASSEIGKLLPMVNAVSLAVKSMAGEFAIAGAAIGLVAAGVGAAMSAREQFNQQRVQGRDSGVSGLRLEDLQRKLVRNGSGNVNRDLVASELIKQQELMRDAQSDITGMSDTNRKLSFLGLRTRGPDGRPLGQMDLLQQQGARWQGMSDAKVMAEAKTLGMDTDFALSVKKTGGSIGNSSMTNSDIDEYQKGAESTKKFNDELAKFNENMKELTTTLGSGLLPMFSNLVQNANNLVKDAKPLEGADKAFFDTFVQKRTQMKLEKFNPLTRLLHADDARNEAIAEGEKALAKYRADKEAEKNKKAPSANTSTQKLIESDKTNNQFQSITTDFQTAVNMFALSVSSMKGALNQNEILSNLFRGTGGMFNPGPGSTGSTMLASSPLMPQDKYSARSKYHDMYAAAEAANGLPKGLLERVGMVENEPQDPSIRNKKTGAAGLMQIMPDNFESLGIKDWKDPAQNIGGGGKLLGQYLKMAKGDVRQALSMYNVGLNRQKWNLPAVKDYVNKIAGDPSAQEPISVIAPVQTTKASAYQNANDRKLYAESLSRLTGEPASQILNQGVTEGDMSRINAYALRQAQNSYAVSVGKLQGLNFASQTPGTLIANGAIARASMEASATSADLLRVQRGQEANQFVVPGGATQMTANVPQNVVLNAPITINGAEHPEAVAKAVVDHVNREVKNMVNQNTTQVVR